MNNEDLVVRAEALSADIRKAADAAGRGAIGLALNTLATDAARLSWALRGCGAGAPGVGARPTEGAAAGASASGP